MTKRSEISPARPPGTPGRPSGGGSAEVTAFLAEARSRAPGSGRGRLIFALDATMSRQPAWDLACRLQAEMFDAAAEAGGLEVQLVYYRGHGEAQASRWVADAAALKGLMTGIACHGGLTQIGRVLDHAARTAAKVAGRGAGLRRRRHGGRRGRALPEGRGAGAARHPCLHFPRGRRAGGGTRRSARSPG